MRTQSSIRGTLKKSNMIDRSTKLRWRRNFRRKQRQLEDIGSQTEEQLDRHFFRRLGRLYDVRR